jgi:hypothetical protein
MLQDTAASWYIAPVPAKDYPILNAARGSDTIYSILIPYMKDGQHYALFHAYVLTLDQARWLRARVLRVLHALYPAQFRLNKVCCSFKCGSCVLRICTERSCATRTG